VTAQAPDEPAAGLTDHDATALILLDYGLVLPYFAAAWAGLAGRDLISQDTGPGTYLRLPGLPGGWRVTEHGRRSYQATSMEPGR
jgi:hypothetical protein